MTDNRAFKINFTELVLLLTDFIVLYLTLYHADQTLKYQTYNSIQLFCSTNEYQTRLFQN